jgi:1-deoxy-D-xylulose-5-phosphate reductoisomerase
VFNAANEVAVQRFLDGEIGYLDITEVIGEVLTEHLRTTAFRTSDEVRDVDVVLRADAQVRLQAASWKPQAERRP